MKKLALVMAVIGGPLVAAGVASACNNSVTYYRPVTYTRVVRTATVSQASRVIETKKAAPMPAKRLVDVEVGSTMRVRIPFLGAEQGFVFLTMGDVVMECQITEWTSQSVTFQVPDLALRNSSKVKFSVTRPNGAEAKMFSLNLTAHADIDVLPPSLPEIQIVSDSDALEAPQPPASTVSSPTLRTLR